MILASNLVFIIFGTISMNELQVGNSKITDDSIYEIKERVSELLTEWGEGELSDSINRFKRDVEGTLKKDAFTLAPLVEENSFLKVRKLLENSFQYDTTVTKAAFVDKNNNVWQYVGYEVPLGIDIGAIYDLDSGTWQGTYQGESVSYDLLALKNFNTPGKDIYFIELNTKENKLEVIDDFDIAGVEIFQSAIKVYSQNGDFLGVLYYEFSTKILRSIISNKNRIFNSAEKEMHRVEEEIASESSILTKSMNKRIKIFGIGFIISFLIISSLGALYFINKILKPLVGLSTVMSKAEKGEYHEYEFISSRDEIEDLSVSFNSMISAINKRDGELNDYKTNLENILNKRTTELEEERARNIHASKLAEIEEMAKGIAHEINNPLAIIKLKLKVAIKKMNSDNPDKFNVVKILHDGIETVNRANAIINRLRGFSNHDSIDKINLESNSITKMFDGIFDLCITSYENKKIKVIKNFESDYIVNIDKIKFSQAIYNIMTNAMQAVEMVEDKWVEISVYQENEFLVIKVINSGPKIDKDISAKAMNPFFTTRKIGTGTGLGLSISNGFINAHGGTLSIDSDHSYTCFVVSIPYKLAA